MIKKDDIKFDVRGRYTGGTVVFSTSVRTGAYSHIDIEDVIFLEIRKSIYGNILTEIERLKSENKKLRELLECKSGIEFPPGAEW